MNFEPGNDPGREVVSGYNLLFGFNYHFNLITMGELKVRKIESNLQDRIRKLNQRKE